LAGLVSHKFASGDLSKFRCCVYGQITYQVRVSHYADWIRSDFEQITSRVRCSDPLATLDSQMEAITSCKQQKTSKVLC
jgi:hypothetical protein